MITLSIFPPIGLALTLLAASAGAPLAAQPVPVVALQLRAVASSFELDGNVQAVRQSTVSTQTSGRIVALAVKAGERVRAGQLLATIDEQETRAGLQRSQAQAAQADAELRQARLNFERNRELVAKGFVSQAALDGAEAQFKASQAGREQASAAVTQSRLTHGYNRVTAPFDGWVSQTHAEAGELALPGKPLLTLYAPNPVRAVVQVPASRAELVRQATRIEVQAGLPGSAAPWIKPSAQVVLPATDPVTQTVEWRLELPAAASTHLLPGQQVRVRFAGALVQRNVVPAAALLRRGELTAVYVASTHGFVLKAVRLGADFGDSGIEVLAGLQPGDRVALDPVKAGLAGAKAASTP